MSNPPRRSRPKRPGQTIDLKAQRSGTVGYAGPVSETAADPADPEARLAEAAAPSAEERVAPVPGDAGSPAGGGATVRDFAEDEGLLDPGQRERPAEEFEDETILAAAEPDLAAREGDPGGPPPPSYDYHAPTSLPPPETRGGGFGTALGAGLLGAFLALLGGGLLQYAGVLPALGRPDPAELSQQFASIGDVQQVTADFTTLRDDVEQLKSTQAAGGAGAGATTADLNAVADRVTAVEQRVAQPAPARPLADPAVADAARTTAEEARGIAETAKASAETAGRTAEAARQTADGARQTADGARQAADGARQAAETAAGAVAAIRQTADASSAAASGAKQSADNAVQSAATAQQTAATAQQAATSAQQAATAAQGTAGAANEALAGFEPRVAAIEAASRQAAISVAAASLKSAIDEGGPFMGPLERFATVSGASPAVETLRGFAASGVPSKASLAAAWPAAEEAIRTALRPAPVEGDVRGQVLSGLSALVTVRQAGPAPAAVEGPEAALSRLGGAIESGDLAAFLAEWDKLPDAGRQASADFQARVKARAETEQVVGDTLDDAVQAVGAAG